MGPETRIPSDGGPTERRMLGGGVSGTHRCVEGRIGRSGRPRDGVGPPEIGVSEEGSPDGGYRGGGVPGVGRMQCGSFSGVSGPE